MKLHTICHRICIVLQPVGKLLQMLHNFESKISRIKDEKFFVALHLQRLFKPNETKILNIGIAGYSMFARYGLLCLDTVRCALQASGGMERRGKGSFRGSVVDGSE